MANHSKTSRKLFIGLALAVVLDTGLQILWKAAVVGMPDETTLWQTTQNIFHQPAFLMVGLLMAGQACNWVVVLDHADLSYAHAITSLSYVSVAMLSVLCLGESITFTQAIGIILILAGVWCVGKSGSDSAPLAGQTP